MKNKIRKLFPGHQVVQLEKGWSKDRKYLLHGEKGKSLLRVSESRTLSQQKAEFHAICAIKESDRIIRPLSYGILDERHTYIRYSYVEGVDLKEAIDGLDALVQYDLGIQAGILLRGIHEVEAEGEEEVSDRYNRKITRKISDYKDCGVKLPKLEEAVSYLEENRALLRNRPKVLLHGDYHMGNMILHGKDIHIIDFNRYDFGDPYEEFDRMTMNTSFSPQFSKGLLHGYFRGSPPMEFWHLLKLYALTNAVGSISWARKYSPESMDFILEMIDNTLDDYAEDLSPMPRWYQKLIGWHDGD